MRFVIGLFTILFLLIVGLLVAPNFINWDQYKTQGQEQIKSITGYDVAIDGCQIAQAGGIEHAGPVAPVGPAKRRAAEPEAEAQCRPFRYEGGGGDAFDAPAEAEDEPEVEEDVQAVHPDLQDQNAGSAFMGDEPAGHAEKRDGGWSSPDADSEVAGGKGLDLGARRGKPEGEPE